MSLLMMFSDGGCGSAAPVKIILIFQLKQPNLYLSVNTVMWSKMFLCLANRWRGLPAAHPGRHCQDPVNQIRTRPEDLQLHPHVEERGRGVRAHSVRNHSLPTGSLCSSFINTQLKTLLKSARTRFVCRALQQCSYTRETSGSHHL